MNSNSSFNQRCYQLLMHVPAGRVTTYKALAEALGTKAFQAVGRAMNQNPNPIEVPCHRVVNSDGCLGGYAFGPERKQALLEAEGVKIRAGKIDEFDSVRYDFGVA